MKPRKVLGFVLLSLPSVAILTVFVFVIGWAALFEVLGLVLGVCVLCLIGGYGLHLIRKADRE